MQRLSQSISSSLLLFVIFGAPHTSFSIIAHATLLTFLDVPQLKGFAQDVHVQQAFLRQFRAGFNPLPGNQIDVKYRYNFLRNLYLHLYICQQFYFYSLYHVFSILYLPFSLNMPFA